MKFFLNLIKYVYITLSIAFILWGFVSWCDIIADNTEPNPQHYDWNLFVMMTEDR